VVMDMDITALFKTRAIALLSAGTRIFLHRLNGSAKASRRYLLPLTCGGDFSKPRCWSPEAYADPHLEIANLDPWLGHPLRG
jgi:hypothetical protein